MLTCLTSKGQVTVPKRKCMSCGEFFLPEPRSGERQRFCAAGACRRASKAAKATNATGATQWHDILF